MSHGTADSNMAAALWADGSMGAETHCVMAAPTDDALGTTARLPGADRNAGEPIIVARGSRRLRACPCPRWKRAMDVTGSLLGLAILWPLFVMVGLLIKCVSRGPVFFRQRRYGLRGRPFIVWKFRTMETTHAPVRHLAYVADLMHNGQPLKKIDDEFEIIPGGRILRRLGIDELPQLINVLTGEMSLVGPRPDVMPPSSFGRWRRRFDVVPGITGLWQVSGKNRTTFDTMMRLDIAYIRRRSFWLDVAILLRTFLAVVRN
jgi:lipopolysaccharide/colanic/teichoic acid biosynthesis glycosyltransferase